MKLKRPIAKKETKILANCEKFKMDKKRKTSKSKKK